jgi:ribosomal protein L29
VRLLGDIVPGYRRLQRQLEQVRAGLQAELDELRRELQAELDEIRRELQSGLGELRRELAQVKTVVEDLRRELAQVKTVVEEQKARWATWAPPGHFYSPLVDPNDPIVQRVLVEDGRALPDTDDLKLDIPLILEWFERISRHYCELPFGETRREGLRYFYQNPTFSAGDAISLFGMLLELKPQRLVEVGSGFSSCVAMDTNDRFLDHRADMIFLDPYPETILSLLEADDPYRRRIIAIQLQTAPLELFTQLEAGDIFFIDSSHVSKLGSDVNDYLFRILPVLRSGVVVHIHDIPYPFEYESPWIVTENRSWNEAYAVRAFLQYNHAFRVLYFNHFMRKQFSDLLEAKMPRCIQDCGASLWLQKV